MADPVLEAACVDYLLAAGLPSAPADVAALMAFVEERASLLYGVADANEPVADPKLASKARRPTR